jgi:tetratricopeptide (TPR) repeat protein
MLSMLNRWNLIVTTIIFWYCGSLLVLAQTKKPEQMDKFPPSPLEITKPDPLLPSQAGKQPLTATERQQLEMAVDKLNQEALTTLQAGDKETAFEIWNRELRLRRFLGSLAEVEALGRVGAIAGNENERPQVQYITQRLQAIQKQMQKDKSTDLELWRSLGQAYQKVRTPKLAVAIYQQILTLVRQQRDQAAELATLNTLGELYLSWFDYPQAATTYEELRKLAANRGASETAYLQKLAYIYEQSKQDQAAIEVLTKLVEIYTKANELTQMPVLRQAIATHYESLADKNPNFLTEAFNQYQAAYTSAWQLQQYARASEALQKLIALYRSQKQIDAALQTSQILLETQALASNAYGLMQTYDQIAQLYLDKKNYPQALAALKKGLELAQGLQHQEAYFKEQIEKLQTGGKVL